MTESQENLLDAFSRVESEDQLISVLPPSVIEKLGGGEAGKFRAFGMLIALTPFAPAPSTFDEDAFNAIVAVDYETDEPLPEQEQQEMLNVAVEAGFVQKVQFKSGIRYAVKKELQDAIKRVIGK